MHDQYVSQYQSHIKTNRMSRHVTNNLTIPKIQQLSLVV